MIIQRYYCLFCCLHICSDAAESKSGETADGKHKTKQQHPIELAVVNYVLYCYPLAVKTSVSLKNILNEAVKIISFISSQHLTAWLLKYKSLLPYAATYWMCKRKNCATVGVASWIICFLHGALGLPGYSDLGFWWVVSQKWTQWSCHFKETIGSDLD